MWNRLAGGAIVCLLLVFPETSDAQAVPDNSIEKAIGRSIPLLQKTDATFLQKARCVSCHHNTLTAMTVSLARKNGFAVDEDIAGLQLKAAARYIEDWRERTLQGIGIPGLQDTISYILIGLGAEEHPADAATDAMAYFLKSRQQAQGKWTIRANRPPIEYSDITVTATSLRALQLYAPLSEKPDYEEAVQRAALWLSTQRAHTSEEHALRLLGMVWGNLERIIVQRAVRELLVEQHFDGGWAQLPAMKSDAYATGQVLVALHEAGVPSNDPAYQRGVQFLLNTQLEDGSWYVKTRSTPIQPYFESGFPHGGDQWISAAATGWATMALIHTR